MGCLGFFRRLWQRGWNLNCKEMRQGWQPVQFCQFKNVKDVNQLEGSLKNVNMGGWKLKVNIARFAMENKEVLIPQGQCKAQENRKFKVQSEQQTNDRVAWDLKLAARW
ncbi:hypothetical protein Hanom_Chr05g00443331 [Helianthus anomalus]